VIALPWAGANGGSSQPPARRPREPQAALAPAASRSRRAADRRLGGTPIAGWERSPAGDATRARGVVPGGSATGRRPSGEGV